MFFRTYWSFGNITLLLNKKYKCSLLVRCRADVFFSSQLRLLQYQGVGVDQHLSAVSGQVHTKLCTLCTVQCTLCTVQCTLCTVQCTLCTVQCKLCTVQCTLCTVQSTICTVQCTLCTLTIKHSKKFIKSLIHISTWFLMKKY